MTNVKAPLQGVRILAVSQYGAGPFATQLLCDLGAEVIKVENPSDGGDVGRRVPPLFAENNSSLFFESHNRGKKSVGLRIDTPAGQSVLRKLARESDVVFHNLRGDVAIRLGLTYAALQEVNPRLVCCALTGYGMHGPEASLPGYDYLFQGRAGWMSLTGPPDSYPIKSGLSLVDLSAGMMAALSMASAVYQVRETGIGGDVEVSLYDTALSLLGYIGTWTMSREWEADRLAHSAHPSVIPFQEFPTADGHIVIACVKDKFFFKLCDIMELSDLRERYPTMFERVQNRSQVTRTLEARFRTLSTREWMEKLRGHVPCEPVYTVKEALDSGEIPRQRGLLIEYEHPTLGICKTLGPPFKGWWKPTGMRAPFFGENTIDILRNIGGLSEQEVAELEQGGIVCRGDAPCGH
ncbi:CaiB/BaiF CoA transferase family protein [Alicyclobacillus dauci]|uniref:CoA transferase n=1 Tax=Alicyclobacillus dauci TaxID=1475485 RepID=A0ABY6Z2S3_9BACL|nr:CoA transferase [Alicyclobacillus dauci]WAH37142.1 CoA transferase [Alicyclobacillus dauci]